MNEEDRVWRAMVKAKYGVEVLNWIPSKHIGAYRVGLWKFIAKGWDLSSFISFMRSVMDPLSSFGILGGVVVFG